MVKKIVKKIKSRKDPFALQVGEAQEDDGTTYWEIIGTEYYVGFDEDSKHFVYDPDSESGWDHLHGWAGYSDRKTLLRDFGRYLGMEAPVPPYESKKDKGPRDKTHVLVALDKAPYHPRFPLINPDLGLPETTTFYRMTKAGKFECMVSIDAGDLHLAWDQCGSCGARVTRCRCPKGSTPPRAIVWCCTGAATNWEGTATYRQYEATLGTAPTSRTRSSVATKPATPAPTPAAAQKPAQPATGMVADLDRGDLDLGAVAEAAQKEADEATRKVRKVIRRKK